MINVDDIAVVVTQLQALDRDRIYLQGTAVQWFHMGQVIQQLVCKQLYLCGNKCLIFGTSFMEGKTLQMMKIAAE